MLKNKSGLDRFGYLPHLALMCGIIAVSAYIVYLMINPTNPTSHNNPTPPNQFQNSNPTTQANQATTTTPIVDPYLDDTHQLIANNIQTQQPPFDMTLEITDSGFVPIQLQLNNQQLLRIVNSSQVPQVITLNEESVLIYQNYDYVYSLDTLNQGVYPIWADSEGGSTNQTSMTIYDAS